MDKRKYQNQTGAVLFTGLITLVVLSLVALSSMQGSTLEQRMAGNINDQILAFEAAEAALLDAEALIQSDTLVLADFQSNSNGTYENDSDTIWQDVDWSTAEVRTSGFSPVDSSSNSIIASSPKFVIQFLGQTTTDNTALNSGAPVIDIYRITARGTGRSDDSIVLLESTYGFSTSTNADAIPFLGRQTWRQIEF